MHRRDFLTGTSVWMGLAAMRTGAPHSAAKSILEYGAKPDGRTLNTRSIQRAIDDVSKAGGGIVYVPPGTYLIGGLELKSRVTLYLEAGSVLLGSTSFSDYDYHPGPPMQGDANGHHVIFAQDAEDVALCGLGTIDGQGESYWENVHRKPFPPEEAWRDVSAWDYRPRNQNRRPSPMVEFARCKNVRISGITLHNSAGWTLRPIACETVVIDGIRVRNPNYGSNTDGMDITASSNVFVSNCDIDTGDDAICIKSENPYGEVLPTRNITITNCTLTTSCNGLKLGTASRGAFENIVFSNSVIYGRPGSALNTRVIGGINVEVVDGGSANGIVVSNIRMQYVRAPIFVRLGARNPRPGSFLRNVLIQGIDAEDSIITSSITGLPGLQPSDITVTDCRIRTIAHGEVSWRARQIPEAPDAYPESTMMGHLPAYGFYVRHANRVRIRNVEIITDKPDARPAVVTDDVDDLILDGVETTAPAANAPVFELKNTRNALMKGMRSPAKSQTFVHVSGSGSADINLLANLLPLERQCISLGDGASEKAITIR